MSIWDRILKMIQRQDHSKSRSTRVKILPIHQISFEVFSEDEFFVLEVMNLSTQGIGIKKNNNVKWQALGKQLTGELKIQGRGFRATIEIRHISALTVGAKILSGDTDLVSAIENYLFYEITGLSLKPVDESLLQKKGGEKIYWYTDAHKNEVYIVLNGEELSHFYITFLGNHLSYQKGQKPKYGHVIEQPPKNDYGYKGSDQVRYLDTPPPEVGRIAFRIISGVNGLDEAVKKKIELALQPILKHIQVEE